MASAADMFPTIEESSFCSNFQCCGRSLKDLHELLQHYEDSHVRIEDGDEEALTSGMFDFDTVLAADSLLNVGAEASSSHLNYCDAVDAQTSIGGLFTPTPSSTSLTARPSPHSKRPRILTLGIEPCDYANDDSEHLSAFDNTVIRPIDPYRIYGTYNGYHGYARIAPKRSHSVPALPNFPLLNGESGFKLIHSILSSTADPPSSENYPGYQNSSSSIGSGSHGMSSSIPSSSSSTSSHSGSGSGYASMGYSIGRSGNDRPFVCPVGGCGKTYKNANGLKYHAIHGHDGVLVEKPHKCPFSGCGKRYKNSNGLKYHFQHAHPNTPPPSNLAMTPSSSSGYSSNSNGYNRSSHGYSGSYPSSGHASSIVQAQAPARPHSTVNHMPHTTFTRPTPSVSNTSTNLPASNAPSTTTAYSSSSSNNTSTNTNTTSYSYEAVQNLLAAAPNTIASLLKKNPNLKQHLPTILRNLQQFAMQKSNNNNNNNSVINNNNINSIEDKKISSNNNLIKPPPFQND